MMASNEGDTHVKPAQYRKKSVVIEAVRLDRNAKSLAAVSSWMLGHDFTSFRLVGASRSGVAIDTLEGTMLAAFGDWIIRGIGGEFYPCKPSIFEATYERVEKLP